MSASAMGDTGTGHSDHHHVHFDTASLKNDDEFDSSVIYQPTEDGIIINLGFLQIKHKYEIDLKLPSKFFGDTISDAPPILKIPAEDEIVNTKNSNETNLKTIKSTTEKIKSNETSTTSFESTTPTITTISSSSSTSSTSTSTSTSNTVPNLYCKITDFSGHKSDKNDYFEMKIEFFAYKEKLIKEQLIVVNSKNCKEIFKLIIIARVLGKGKGTPMLKNGIHCIGVDRDCESESDASDFCGFSKGK